MSRTTVENVAAAIILFVAVLGTLGSVAIDAFADDCALSKCKMVSQVVDGNGNCKLYGDAVAINAHAQTKGQGTAGAGDGTQTTSKTCQTCNAAECNTNPSPTSNGAMCVADTGFKTIGACSGT